MKYDLCILGGGPGGYYGALHAAREGLKVLLIEEKRVGGTCLHEGCIPTKALLHSTGALASLHDFQEIGLMIEEYSFSYERAHERKREIVETLFKGMENLLLEEGVTLLQGRGTLIERGNVLVKERRGETLIDTKTLIIATGSKPKELALLPFSHERVMDSTEALSLETPPGSLIIIGGGAIGLEMATLFNDLGTQVTILELLPSLLPGEEREGSEILGRALEKRGVRILTSSEVLSVDEDHHTMVLKVRRGREEEEELRGERVLVTIGRQPNLPKGLKELGISSTKRGIVVNSRMETSIPGIYAIGDVIGNYLLAHVAYQEALMAVENILGRRREIDDRFVPRCVYTRPEMAAVGLTEEEVKKEYGSSYEVKYYPFQYNGRALIENKSDGFFKLLLEKEYGEPLGLTIVGPKATEIISSGVLSLSLEMTKGAMEEMILPHPTLSESLRDLFLQ